MAKLNNNELLIGMTGRLGSMISLRQVNGQTEAFRRPGKRNGKPHPTQVAQNNHFLEAVYYAKSVIAIPEKKALYQAKANAAKRQSAYSVALTDFMNPPVIEFIQHDHYHGQPGGFIVVRATDDFKVIAVKVTITEADGGLIEEGSAVALPSDKDWLYISTKANQRVVGSMIIATASDMPGNEVVFEKEVQ